MVATLLAGVSAAAQEAGFNDLTEVGANPLKYKKFVPDDSCNGGSGGLLAGIGCPPQTYPFELLLVNLDTSDLPIGGEAIALLRLRNVGRDPASVPWITDPDQIELPDDRGSYKFSEAELRADIVQDRGGTTHIGIPVHLYGAKEVPGSLQEIRPGEYVEMKIALVADCETHGVQCQSLKTGPARLSFTWTEEDSRETYEKCGIQSSRIRTRELASNAAAVIVVGRMASH